MSRSILKVVHPPGYPAERAYVVRLVLGHWLGLDHELHENAGAESWQMHLEDKELTFEDVLFRTAERDWLTAASLPAGPELYGNDLLGNVFFLVTRYEELALRARDEHDRFAPDASASLIERPRADRDVEILWSLMESVWPRLERRTHAYRLVPSHDVDYPYASLRLRASAVKRGQLRAALPPDPFDTFDLLMDASEEAGVRAAFYFLADGTIYSLDDPRSRRLLRRVHDRGHELGLHGGYETFRDPARLKSELERLLRACSAEGIEQEEWGARQHFLRWENPITWRAYEEAGLAYDTSLGYSAQPGFRAGTCREYPVFDLEQRRELRLRERPLVLMDTPTLDRLGLPDEELVALIERLRGECVRFGGGFTVLWHNNWLVTARQRRLLQAALAPVDI